MEHLREMGIEGGTEEYLSRSGSPRILPRNLKTGMPASLFFPMSLSAHKFWGEGIFIYRSWCGSVIITQRKWEHLAAGAVYLSSPKLYWSVEKGRKSGQAWVSQHLMALHPPLLPSQGHLTSVSECLTLAKKELRLAWVGWTQIPVDWSQLLGWGDRG